MYHAKLLARSFGAAVLGTILVAAPAQAQKGSLKNGWITSPVGTVTVRGSATSSPSGRMSVTGEGTDIASTADGFQFTYRRFSGNIQITARITGVQNTDPWAKAGVMIRQSLVAGSVHASLLLMPTHGIVFRQRTTTNGDTSGSGVSGIAPSWLRMTRVGESLTASLSADGLSWIEVGSASLATAGEFFVGLAVTSHRPSQLATATFDKVSITVPNVPLPPPPSGPVAAWSFDDGIGLTARDAVGDLDGVIEGATWTTAGRFGGALLFDGVDNRVTVRSGAPLNLTTGMTLEAWVNPAALTTWRSVAVKEGSTDLAYGLYANDPSSQPQGAVNVGAGRLAASGATALPTNKWSHVAVTFDGTVVALFIDGVQVAAAPANGSLIQTSGEFRIGGNSLLGEWFSGAIDDVRVYDRALTANEIQADMSTPVEPPPPDTTPPSVTVSSPVSGSTVSGTVSVVANATDDTGVASVQFLLDASNLGSAVTSAPYAVTWNTVGTPNGTYKLTAVARDLAGNANVSQDVTVAVSNADTTPPSVTISSPVSGSTVSGIVTVVANATDNVGVTSVQFLLNGSNLGSAVTAPPYSVAWNTVGATNGTYKLTAVARDLAGNSMVSLDVTVAVSNSSPNVLVNGRYVQFTSADHFATMSTGTPKVSGYTLEVWLPGSNTSTGQPYRISNLGKPTSTTTTIKVDQQTFFSTLPKNQQFFTTVTALGPGGSARSAPSNTFSMQ